MPYWIEYDPEAPPGQRLAPEVIAEIVLVAPSTVNNGSITAAKLAPDAVTREKIAPGAVGTVEIDTHGVETANIAPQAVTTAELADSSVTMAKTAAGVQDVVDSTGNPVTSTAKYVTAAEYAAIVTPDPNVEYRISG